MNLPRMKTSLQIKLGQHLTLTPQLQQSIKLLQLSTVELNQELDRMLLENPLLERDDPDDDGLALPYAAAGEVQLRDADRTADDSSTGGGDDTAVMADREERGVTNSDSPQDFDDDASFGGTGNRRDDDGDDDGEYGQVAAAEPSLIDHLTSQLAMLGLGERDRKLAMAILGHLDEDGYLADSIEDITDEIREYIDVEPDDLQIALRHVQSLEPTGVGARSLSECLKLQLNALPIKTPGRSHALILVEQCLDALASRDFTRMKRVLRCTDDELKLACELVVSLEPKPGRNFGVGETRYIVPDVVVRKANGKWRAALNQEAMPKLRVNQLYADILQKSRDANGKNLAGQLQEARWLIKNVQQRFDTILRVTEAIVERQKHFFDLGDVAMRPLVLREIADELGLHESTISRVTTQKYMQTPRGIFELKYFFTSSVATDDGGTYSSTAIRALIRQLVDAEDTKKPLSDNRIADILAEKGIVVARRTIAKYREALQIHPASMRKTM